MSYRASGLGQAATGITLSAGTGGGVARLQQRLISLGLLAMRVPDGMISSSSSATLTAVRTFATAHGLSATAVTRMSDGGLSVPVGLHDAIMGTVTSPPPPSGYTPSGPGTFVDSKTGAPVTPGSAGPFPTMPASTTNWMPWAIGGSVVVIGLGFVAVMMQRSS
jgi:peptidoglycan hydrolase-like protein with peptidoglycan-binding domain